MQQPYTQRSSIYLPRPKDLETRPHAGSLPDNRTIKKMAKPDIVQNK